MNRSFKNIFAITALALTCSSALHAQDTQSQVANKGKLQSAIDYLKNIRTPLTPQETLAQFIGQADVDGFKNTYNSYHKWIPSDRVATLQALTITAQEVKQQLQQELESTGNKIKKSTLVKGVAQTIFGTYCTLATMFSLAYKGKYKKEDKTFAQFDGNVINFTFANFLPSYKKTFMNKLGCTLVNNIIGLPVVLPEVISLIVDNYVDEKLTALTNIIVTPLTGYIAYNSLKSGIKNIKNGWNYKAYVEQQIANVDEINEFIQAQLKLS